MRSIIRDNYTPHAGDYHDRLVHDPIKNNFWLFDCDGVFWDARRFGPEVMNVKGDARNKAVSQALFTSEIDEMGKLLSEESEARQTADNELTERINTIEASTDVKDVVGTHAELESYDTSKLGDNDIIKVLADETEDGATVYYRWDKAANRFNPVGKLGPFATKADVDAQLAALQATIEAGLAKYDEAIADLDARVTELEISNAKYGTITYRPFTSSWETWEQPWGTLEVQDVKKWEKFVADNQLSDGWGVNGWYMEGQLVFFSMEAGEVSVPGNEEDILAETGLLIILDEGHTIEEVSVDLRYETQIDWEGEAIYALVNEADFMGLSTGSGWGQNLNLARLTMPGSVVMRVDLKEDAPATEIPAYFLANCGQLHQEALVIPNKVKKIGDYFLSGITNNGETLEISLPEGLEVIGEYFMNNNIYFNSPFTVPSTVTSVGSGFLANCDNFTSVVTVNCPVAAPFPSGFSFATYNSIAPMYLEGVGIAGPYAEEWVAFYNVSAGSYYRNVYEYLDGGTLYWNDSSYQEHPYKIKTKEVFNKLHQTGLIQIREGQQIYSLNPSATTYTIVKVELGEGVTEVGDNFLSFWDRVGTVTFPSSVTKIGEGALNGIRSLREVNLPGTLKRIPDRFLANSGIQEVTFPEGVEEIGDWVLNNCTSLLLGVHLPETLKTIGTGFMDGCTAFDVDLTIPSSVTSIASYFLHNCTSYYLRRLRLNCPASVAENNNYILSVDSSSAPVLTHGLKIAGPYRTEWMEKFPDRPASTGFAPYRKLIDGGE